MDENCLGVCSSINRENFQQQRIQGWTPRVTLSLAIVLYFLSSILFLILGSFILSQSRSVVRLDLRYDHLCSIGQTCVINFSLDQEIQGPVVLAYRLTNFY